MIEKQEWKLYRNALGKSDRKKFDEMWELPKFHISACSNSVQYVRLHPILMSILLYHYKQLTACISEVKEIESRINNSSQNNKSRLTFQKKLQLSRQSFWFW
jgi:hypothetical protein